MEILLEVEAATLPDCRRAVRNMVTLFAMLQKLDEGVPRPIEMNERVSKRSSMKIGGCRG